MGSVGGYKHLVHVGLDGNGSNQKKRTDNVEKGIKHPQSSNNAKHRWTEKQRRRKMNNMYQQLEALLPKEHQKANLTIVVEETISYIKSLEQTLQKLETQKLERFNGQSTNTALIHPQKHNMESLLDIVSCPKSDSVSFPDWPSPIFQTWASSNVSLNVCGQDALINICSSKKSDFLGAICFVLEKYKMDTIFAQVYSDQSKRMVTIHARVNATADLLDAFSYEEIYKKATLDIMLRANFGSM